MAKGEKSLLKTHRDGQSQWLSTISEKISSISLETEANFYCKFCGGYFESHFL